MNLTVKRTIIFILYIATTAFFIYIVAKLLLFFQKYSHVKSGEIFYNSEHVAVLALFLGLLFYMTLCLHYRKFFPNLWNLDKAYAKKKVGINIDKMIVAMKWGRRFTIVLCLVFLGSFNNYIKLSNNYITASSWSWFPWSNEEQYSYSDIKIGYDYQIDKNGYTSNVKNFNFIFADEKRVFGILKSKDLIGNIQQKQSNSNYNVSVPRQNIYKNSWLEPYMRAIVSFVLLFFLTLVFKFFRQKKK